MMKRKARRREYLELATFSMALRLPTRKRSMVLGVIMVEESQMLGLVLFDRFDN